MNIRVNNTYYSPGILRVHDLEQRKKDLKSAFFKVESVHKDFAIILTKEGNKYNLPLKQKNRIYDLCGLFVGTLCLVRTPKMCYLNYHTVDRVAQYVATKYLSTPANENLTFDFQKDMGIVGKDSLIVIVDLLVASIFSVEKESNEEILYMKILHNDTVKWWYHFVSELTTLEKYLVPATK